MIDDKSIACITKGNGGLIHAFQSFYLNISHQRTISTENEWKALSSQESDTFHISSAFVTQVTQHMQVSQGPEATLFTSIYNKRDPPHDFKRGIKRDHTAFIALEYDNGTVDIEECWHRHVAEILDKKSTPSDNAERALFEEKQKYMYSFFRSLFKQIKERHLQGNIVLLLMHEQYPASFIHTP